MKRHKIERCNKPAAFVAPNGYRACVNCYLCHEPADAGFTRSTIGLCDRPTDGRGAMNYRERTRLGPIATERQ